MHWKQWYWHGLSFLMWFGADIHKLRLVSSRTSLESIEPSIMPLLWLWYIHHRNNHASHCMDDHVNCFTNLENPKQNFFWKASKMVLPLMLSVHSTGILLTIKVIFIILLLMILLGFQTFPIHCYPHSIGVSTQMVLFHCFIALLRRNILMNVSLIDVRKKSSKQYPWIQNIAPHGCYCFCFRKMLSWTQRGEKFFCKKQATNCPGDSLRITRAKWQSHCPCWQPTSWVADMVQ